MSVTQRDPRKVPGQPTIQAAVDYAADHIDACSTEREMFTLAEQAFLNGHGAPVPKATRRSIERRVAVLWAARYRVHSDY